MGWIPTFVCPECGASLRAEDAGWACRACGIRYVRDGDVFRFVSEPRLKSCEAFLAQYRAVRKADGHGVQTEAAYRALPVVPATDPAATEWRIRAESVAALRQHAGLDAGRARRVLDVGAGNGWLSQRLAGAGHVPVALDVNDDPCDGLRTARLGAHEVPLVQSHFDALPFAPGQFDVVVMNASLHYSADVGTTLGRANEMLAPGGALVVMDSPLFERAQDGEVMVKEQADRMRARYQVADPLRPGIGFLTFAVLHDAAERLGRSVRFFASRGPMNWRLRRLWSTRRLGRAAAAFGVWVAE